jgi:hypothetical protein
MPARLPTACVSQLTHIRLQTRVPLHSTTGYLVVCLRWLHSPRFVVTCSSSHPSWHCCCCCASRHLCCGPCVLLQEPDPHAPLDAGCWAGNILSVPRGSQGGRFRYSCVPALCCLCAAVCGVGRPAARPAAAPVQPLLLCTYCSSRVCCMLVQRLAQRNAARTSALLW